MVRKDTGFVEFMDNFAFPNPKRERISEDEFIDDLIKGCNYSRGLLYEAAMIDPTNNQQYIGIIQSILTGYMARIFKLYDTFVLLASDNKAEIAWIFTRLLSEISIQLKYLLSCQAPSDVANKFIKSSLAYDKFLYEYIKSQISDRAPSNIENRILSSIDREFKETNFDINTINSKDKNWCLDTFNLAKEVGLEGVYESIFRTSSSALHGSWFHLKEYYLTKVKETYQPCLNFHAPNPQIIEGTTIIVLRSTKDYVVKITHDRELGELFDYCISWFVEMGKQHEKYLAESK